MNLITPEVAEQVAKSKAEALQIGAQARTVVVMNDADEVMQSKCLTALHARLQALETERMKIKRPLLDAGKALDAMFAEPIRALTCAKEDVSRALGAYRQKRQAEKDALLAKMNTPAPAPLQPGAHTITLSPAPTLSPAEARAALIAGTEEATKIAGTRETTKFEITITDAAAVPREFCVPSESLLRAAAEAAYKTGGTEIKIAGVEITRVVRVVPTGR